MVLEGTKTSTLFHPLPWQGLLPLSQLAQGPSSLALGTARGPCASPSLPAEGRDFHYIKSKPTVCQRESTPLILPKPGQPMVWSIPALGKQRHTRGTGSSIRNDFPPVCHLMTAATGCGWPILRRAQAWMLP